MFEWLCWREEEEEEKDEKVGDKGETDQSQKDAIFGYSDLAAGVKATPFVTPKQKDQAR